MPRAIAGPLRRLMDRQVRAVKGERAVGLGEAYLLGLCSSQLAELANADPGRIPALVRLLRREPAMSSASIRRNLR